MLIYILAQCKRSRNVQPSSTSPPPPVELIPIDTSNNNIEYTTVTALKKELQGNPNIRKIKIEEILSRDEFLGEGTFRIVKTNFSLLYYILQDLHYFFNQKI